MNNVIPLFISEGGMRKVVASNLAMRFYHKHKWSESEVKQFIADQSYSRRIDYKSDQAGGYWVPSINTTIDIQKLLDYPVQVIRVFDDNPDESDFDHLQRINW